MRHSFSPVFVHVYTLSHIQFSPSLHSIDTQSIQTEIQSAHINIRPFFEACSSDKILSLSRLADETSIYYLDTSNTYIAEKTHGIYTYTVYIYV